jgi:hypothetical protein
MTKRDEQQLRDDVTTIKVKLDNGIISEIKEIATWIRSHPQTCPMTDHIAETIDTLKERKTNGWTILFGIMGMAGMVCSLIVVVVK